MKKYIGICLCALLICTTVVSAGAENAVGVAAREALGRLFGIISWESLQTLDPTPAEDGQSFTALYRKKLEALREGGRDLPPDSELTLGFGKSIRQTPNADGDLPVLVTILVFNDEGRILDAYIDETAMPSRAAAESLGLETARAFIDQFRRQQDGYEMPMGSWASQMESYENLFRGRTVEEVEAWFDRYFSDVDGKPLMPGSASEQDAAKYDTLTDDERAALADVTSSATISLKGAHGDILAAMRDAFATRVPLGE